MIEVGELRQLYETAMVGMPADERDLIEGYFFDETKELAFRRSRNLSRAEFAACLESALARMRGFLRSRRIESVSDVF